MQKMDRQLFEALVSLVSRNAYQEALAELEGKGLLGPGSARPASEHAPLALLIADICFKNERYRESDQWLCFLKKCSPEIESDIRYMDLKTRVLIRRKRNSTARKLLEEAISKEWPESQHTYLLYLIGYAHLSSGDYSMANRHFQSCYEYYSSNCDQLMMGHVLHGLGYTAFQRCFYEIAESYFARSLDAMKAFGKESEMGQTHQMLGVLAYRRGMYDEARRNLTLAKLYSSKCSYQRGLVNARIGFARIAIFKGQYRAAERILKGTFKRARAIDYERGAALSAEFLGEIYCHLGEYEDALKHLAIAEKHAEETAPHGDIAVEVLRRKAEVLIALERNEEAEETLIKALEIAEHLHDQHELGAALRAFGTFEARRGDIPAARSYFKEAIATFRLINDSFELANTYFTVAKFNMRWSQGNGGSSDLRAELLDEVRSYATEGMHLFASIDLEDRARECRELSQEIESNTNGNGEPARREKPVFDKRLLRCGLLVAKSQHMRDIVEKTRQIGATASPVFISGETGTGKELVARLVHKSSARAAGPFVAVNCACVPETVFESEIFGHRRGAFTGAISDKTGLMEQASGGTFFLDEVSTLSSGQQAKLLRALQEGKIRRVGELKERPVDVRVVSASNEDAEELLSEGRLRNDFFYRIAARTIEIEPVRKRRDDIVPLFSYFLNRSHPNLEVESGVLKLLESYHWPGNVRQLMNVVSALVSIAAPKGVIRVRDLPIGIREHSTPETDSACVVGPGRAFRRNGVHASPSPEELALTRESILSSLNKWGNNRSAAARELGIGRSTFYRRMKEVDLAGE